jgi:hypothetical protein
MRPRTALAAVALAVLPVLSVAGCAAPAGGSVSAAPPQSAPPQSVARSTYPVSSFGARAAAIAGAWPGSAAQHTWLTLYVPTVDPTVMPSDAFHDMADKTAFAAGRFTFQGPLPSAPPRQTVHWDGGAALELPAMAPLDALKAESGGSCPTAACGSSLTVAAVTATTLRVPTSRGEATVPAWSFRLAGYRDPVVVPAVRSNRPDPGTPRPRPSALDPELVSAGLKSVSADGRTLVLTIVHGACDASVDSDVYESDSAVVVGGTVVPRHLAPNEMCPALATSAPLTVRLAKPLGARTVLDVVTADPEATTGG